MRSSFCHKKNREIDTIHIHLSDVVSILIFSQEKLLNPSNAKAILSSKAQGWKDL